MVVSLTTEEEADDTAGSVSFLSRASILMKLDFLSTFTGDDMEEIFGMTVLPSNGRECDENDTIGVDDSEAAGIFSDDEDVTGSERATEVTAEVTDKDTFSGVVTIDVALGAKVTGVKGGDITMVPDTIGSKETGVDDKIVVDVDENVFRVADEGGVTAH